MEVKFRSWIQIISMLIQPRFSPPSLFSQKISSFSSRERYFLISLIYNKGCVYSRFNQILHCPNLIIFRDIGNWLKGNSSK